MRRKSPKPDIVPQEQPQSSVDIPSGLFSPARLNFDAWDQFSAEFPNHPALQFETIYGLPPDLIAQICRHVPGLFKRDDEHFESRLARIAGQGFFMRHLIQFPLLPEWGDAVENPRQLELKKLQTATQKKLRHSERNGMLAAGFSDEDIAKHFDESRITEVEIDDRRRGYAGWLATNRNFRAGLIRLRTKWQDRISAFGGFPKIGISVFGEEPPQPAKLDRGFYSDCYRFYQHWELVTMASNELPIPLAPSLNAPTFYAQEHLSGLNMNAPLFLFRDRAMDLHALAAQEIADPENEHLRDWFHPANWGHRRFGAMLRQLIFIELALKQRYRDRLRGKTDLLDTAFSAYLRNRSENNDTVKKIRQEMARRLRSTSR